MAEVFNNGPSMSLCHCEERSDEAISVRPLSFDRDCFVASLLTRHETSRGDLVPALVRSHLSRVRERSPRKAPGEGLHAVAAPSPGAARRPLPRVGEVDVNPAAVSFRVGRYGRWKLAMTD